MTQKIFEVCRILQTKISLDQAPNLGLSLDPFSDSYTNICITFCYMWLCHILFARSNNEKFWQCQLRFWIQNKVLDPNLAFIASN